MFDARCNHEDIFNFRAQIDLYLQFPYFLGGQFRVQFGIDSLCVMTVNCSECHENKCIWEPYFVQRGSERNFALFPAVFFIMIWINYFNTCTVHLVLFLYYNQLMHDYFIKVYIATVFCVIHTPYSSSRSFCFFTIQKFNFLAYSIFGCCLKQQPKTE